MIMIKNHSAQSTVNDPYAALRAVLLKLRADPRHTAYADAFLYLLRTGRIVFVDDHTTKPFFIVVSDSVEKELSPLRDRITNIVQETIVSLAVDGEIVFRLRSADIAFSRTPETAKYIRAIQ